MNPSSSDNMLNIKPLPPTGWGPSHTPAVPVPSGDAAEDARKTIATMGNTAFSAQPQAAPAPAATAAQPAPTPIVPQAAPAMASPLASTQPVAPSHIAIPQPTSPAAQQLHAKTRRRYDRTKPIFTALASFLLILALFKAPVLYTQIKYLTSSHPTPVNTVTDANALATNVGPEPLITIPKINVSAPVVYPTSTTNAPNYDPELESGVVHFPNTALPGQAGNTVFFGHSSNDWWQPGGYKFIFVLLDKLVPGDTFSINYSGKRYIYEVTESKIVEATDVSVLSPTSNPSVTLITCWPAGTSLKREIIKAKQISPAPADSTAITQQAPSTNSQVLPGSSPTFFDGVKQFFQNLTDGISGKPSNANTQPATTGTAQPAGQPLPGN